MKKGIAIAIIGFLLHSCSPKVSSNLENKNYSAIETSSDIHVIQVDGELPENSKFIGSLKIGDTGFSNNCGYEKVISEAKKTARASGSNIILLKEVKKPNFGSTCYRIKADMFRNLDDSAMGDIISNKNILNKSRLPADADYALVHVYRPKNFSGAMIGYKIRLNDDTVIGKARNGRYFTHEIRDFKEHTFWAKTESKTEVTIDVKKGQEYFIRCGIKMGIAIGKPEIYLMENNLAIQEISEME